MLLEPGEYTLRLAAVDDDGRGGSVHHSIDARLNKGPSGISVSDLMLVPQPPVAGELPRPTPSTVIDSETMSAMLELTGSDQAARRTKVTLQIADAENGTALVNVEARQVGAREHPRVCGADAPRRAAAGRIRRPRGRRGAGPARDAADTRVHAVAGRGYLEPPPISACRSIPMRRRRRWRRRRFSRRCRVSPRARS